MPSRPLQPPPQPPPPPPPATSHHHHLTPSLLLALTISLTTIFLLLSLLLLLYLYFTLLHRSSPTLPFSTSPPLTPTPTPLPIRRFSPRLLRRATRNFHPSTSLGRGASASVFHAVLPDGKSVAVKLLHSTSPSEFHHELRLFSSGIVPSPSPFIVPILGYSVDKKKNRRILVYEHLSNGSLQEALFSPPESEKKSVLDWDQRINIILDVAQGIAFLHQECVPPVVHGDVKPSNVLLGPDFRAKISDFGLSKIKNYEESYGAENDLFSTPVGDANGGGGRSRAKESNLDDELFSIDHSRELGGDNNDDVSFSGPVSSPTAEDEYGSVNQAGNDGWWWRQDGSGELYSRDYVSEWIGSQICSVTTISNPDFDHEDHGNERKTSPLRNLSTGGIEQQYECKYNNDNQFGERLEQDAFADGLCDRKHKKMREWWKEEQFAETNVKKKKKKKNKKEEEKEKEMEMSKRKHSKKFQCFFGASKTQDEEDTVSAENLEVVDADFSFRKGWSKKKRTCSAGSDMYSGELFSRELSSTTSMRGTVCYVAPESGNLGIGHLMEKTDIYSFGVLILVIVSGRRPLHVLSSPMKLEKANLISWCRQLAQAGSVLDLVDERLKGEFNKEQASLCINLALLCLQRLPELRPEIGEIVRILKGEMELPGTPVEFSPSPPAKSGGGRARRKRKSEVE